MAAADIWSVVFPGATAERSRTLRLALMRLRAGVEPTDPHARHPERIIARDLPCAPAAAAAVVAELKRLGWLCADGWAPNALDPLTVREVTAWLRGNGEYPCGGFENDAAAAIEEHFLGGAAVPE